MSSNPCTPSPGSPLLAGFTTNYDKAGNKLYERHLHSECRSHVYQQDMANRLSQYQRGMLSDPGAWPTTPPSAPSTSLGLPNAFSEVVYDLDLLGHWSSPSLTPADGSTAPNDSRAHNALNQITERGGQSLSYDANGNLTNDGKLRYVYDAINRLKQVFLIGTSGTSDQLLVIYSYDALGRRIKRDIQDTGGGYGGVDGTVKAGATFYTYSGQQCVEERDGTNLSAPARQYVWGHYIDELVQQREYNTPNGTCDLYPVQDIHYRTVALTDQCGSLVETYDTDAYGRTLVFTDPGPDLTWFSDDDKQVSTSLCRHLYTGREYDAETGMYYYRARYYSPVLGRFVQRDPIGYDAGDANLYGYVNGDPVKHTDPSGFTTQERKYWSYLRDAVKDAQTVRLLQDLIKINQDEENEWNAHGSTSLQRKEWAKEQELRHQIQHRNLNVNLASGFVVTVSLIRNAVDISTQTANSTGFGHTDIFYNGTLIRVGHGGAAGRIVNSGQNPAYYLAANAQVVQLRRAKDQYNKLEIGPGKGKSADRATDEEIVAAIEKWPTPTQSCTFSDNCESDVANALAGAGLCGWTTSLPVVSQQTSSNSSNLMNRAAQDLLNSIGWE